MSIYLYELSIAERLGSCDDVNSIHFVDKLFIIIFSVSGKCENFSV